MMTKRWRWLPVLAALLAACGDVAITTGDLDRAAQSWEEEEPAAYHWRADGFVDGRSVDINLVIVDGVVQSENGSRLGAEFGPDGLLTQMRTALDTGVPVQAGFDAVVGYPQRVMIGERIDLTTRDFIPIDRPAGCTSEPGSATDIAAEPAGLFLYADYHRWSDASGCEVRVDVISQIMGPEHCGWESATFVTIGTPIGEAHRTSGARTYIWDPEGDVSEIDGIERNVSLTVQNLPHTASDTGFRAGDAQLWLDNADVTSLYRVVDGVADQFVVDEPRRILCG